MKDNYTKEEIEEVVLRVNNEVSKSIAELYNENINKLDEELKNNPVAREITAIATAQNNTTTTIIESLYILLNKH